ncbi:hypothetical protein IID21_02660 [Patescibacteria group bacterium]|nr:hypothetical protein [Patescibacteria group bacterium]
MSERARGALSGGKVLDVDTATDQVQIRRPDGTVITIGPAYPKRQAEKKTSTKAIDRTFSRIEGAKLSLFYLMEKALSDFPDLLPSDPGFFPSIKTSSPFSSGDAVSLLRRHEYSVERTTDEVIDDFLELSGTLGDVSASSKGIIANLLNPLVYELYIETTEVSPKKTK